MAGARSTFTLVSTSLGALAALVVSSQVPTGLYGGSPAEALRPSASRLLVTVRHPDGSRVSAAAVSQFAAGHLQSLHLFDGREEVRASGGRSPRTLVLGCPPGERPLEGTRILPSELPPTLEIAFQCLPLMVTVLIEVRSTGSKGTELELWAAGEHLGTTSAGRLQLRRQVPARTTVALEARAQGERYEVVDPARAVTANLADLVTEQLFVVRGVRAARGARKRSPQGLAPTVSRLPYRL